MRNYIDITGFVLGWFAIIGQFFLAIENRQTDVTEAVIRFFSYFTVLTNLLVVLYFTSRISIFQKTFIKWFSNIYPYPFINVIEIGYLQVIINSIIVTVTFLAVLSILIFIGKKFFNRESLS